VSRHLLWRRLVNWPLLHLRYHADSDPMAPDIVTGSLHGLDIRATRTASRVVLQAAQCTNISVVQSGTGRARYACKPSYTFYKLTDMDRLSKRLEHMSATRDALAILKAGSLSLDDIKSCKSCLQTRQPRARRPRASSRASLLLRSSLPNGTLYWFRHRQCCHRTFCTTCLGTARARTSCTCRRRCRPLATNF